MRTEDSNNKHKNCKTFHRRTYILQSATVLVLSWKFQKQPSLCLPLLVKVYYYSMTDVRLNNWSPHKKLFFESLFFNKKLHKNSLLCQFEKQPFSSVFKHFLKFFHSQSSWTLFKTKPITSIYKQCLFSIVTNMFNLFQARVAIIQKPAC